MKKHLLPACLAATLLGLAACNQTADNQTTGTADTLSADAHNHTETLALSQDELIKKGEHMVASMGCDDCHSPKKFTELGPEPEPGLPGCQGTLQI